MKRVVLIILLMLPLFVFAKEEVKYDKCVDGDTIGVIRNNEKITVRLLAIDTPEYTKEKEFFGKESSEYTCNSIKNAKKIELEYDSKSNEKDKYGRVLAWVYVDNYLLNDAIVRNGYGEVAYLYDNYKYVDILKEHETLAKLEKVGIWNDKLKEEYNVEDTTTKKDNDLFLWLTVIITIIFTIIFQNKKKLKKLLKWSKINLKSL